MNIFCIKSAKVSACDINQVFPGFKKVYANNIDLIAYALSLSDIVVFNVEIHIYKGYGSQPTMWFENDLMNFIKDLNAQIDLDYHIH